MKPQPIKRKIKRDYNRIKFIKVKNSGLMITLLHNWIIDKKISNAGLISIPLHIHIRKFVDGLKEIPLSEELQNRSS